MIVDRLDPALRQFAANRTDLSASVLGVVRDSLNQRRAEASRDVNTVGVDIENREAQSIPVRIYRGGPAARTGGRGQQCRGSAGGAACSARRRWDGAEAGVVRVSNSARADVTLRRDFGRFPAMTLHTVTHCANSRAMAAR